MLLRCCGRLSERSQLASGCWPVTVRDEGQGREGLGSFPLHTLSRGWSQLWAGRNRNRHRVTGASQASLPSGLVCASCSVRQLCCPTVSADIQQQPTDRTTTAVAHLQVTLELQHLELETPSFYSRPSCPRRSVPSTPPSLLSPSLIADRSTNNLHRSRRRLLRHLLARTDFPCTHIRRYQSRSRATNSTSNERAEPLATRRSLGPPSRNWKT